ncbi:MAG: peptide chain release factor N(5)-glutamine methyltransferase [Deltaproteobacteria bacterium]|nr:peptide chain release factor N(5)-glutamine methyltransferase [Deltaproteobacteria bacterium]
MPEEPWTILKLLHWTTDYFKKNKVAEPRASAEVLLAHLLSRDRLFLYLNYDRPMEAEELATFRTFVRRRLAGEPNQYITGTQEFWSLPFRVNPDVLIPRPETEVLLETVLEFLGSPETEIRLLDLGTGSGAIAVSLAREFDLIKIVATDSSKAAVKLAQENALLNQVDSKIHFVCADMFSAFSSVSWKFAVVATNPPYVSQAEFSELPREIRDYEPRYALDGGPDGLAAIKHIIREAPAVLSQGGALIMEIGAHQGESVSGLVKASQHYESYRIIKDYSGLDRVLFALKKE